MALSATKIAAGMTTDMTFMYILLSKIVSSSNTCVIAPSSGPKRSVNVIHDTRNGTVSFRVMFSAPILTPKIMSTIVRIFETVGLRLNTEVPIARMSAVTNSSDP